MKRRTGSVAASFIFGLCGASTVDCGEGRAPESGAVVSGTGGAAPAAGGNGSTGAGPGGASGTVATAGAGGSNNAATGGAGPAAGGAAPGNVGGTGGGLVSGKASPPASFWQFAAKGYDRAYAIGVDASENIYVAGTTQDSLGAALVGTFDVFVRKYAADGEVLWTRQWGERGYNEITIGGMAVEPSGNFYVVGASVKPGNGTPDVVTGYLRKYGPGGEAIWAQEVTPPANVVALDARNNVYVTGRAAGSLTGSGNGVYLRKYSSSGVPQWNKEFGTPLIERASDIAVDAEGNVYVAGGTLGTVENPNTGIHDGRLRKFDASGVETWTRQLASAADEVLNGVAVDPSGNVYIAGYTDGALDGTGGNLGDADAFLRKYDPSGNVLWTEQFGTDRADIVWAVRVDTDGAAYVAGPTEGSLAVAQVGGAYDAFIRKYDPNGVVQWTSQTGLSTADTVFSLAIAPNGNVYGGGMVYGASGSAEPGREDALIVKLDVR